MTPRVDIPTTRLCKTCTITKAINAFEKQNETRNRTWATYRHSCLDCERAKARARFHAREKKPRTCIDCDTLLVRSHIFRCGTCVVISKREKTNRPVICEEKTCRACKQLKAFTKFYRNRLSPDGLDYSCRECKAAESLARRTKRKANGTCHCGGALREGFKNCAVCAKRHSDWRATNLDYTQKKGYEWRKNVREQVFAHYGKICICCQEARLELLTIDHMNGGGNRHRKEVGSGPTFYRWLIKQGFPLGYQTLCYNCNCSRGHLGICPHERERQANAAMLQSTQASNLDVLV